MTVSDTVGAVFTLLSRRNVYPLKEPGPVREVDPVVTVRKRSSSGTREGSSGV